MNPLWRRLKAVILESDDWGVCAWSPDDRAHRLLADTPAFRSPAGSSYGRSTLESAADVRRIAAALHEVRGGDGFPPVWQANTVVAAPDYARLDPPLFPSDEMPAIEIPAAPSRWVRPGLWEAVGEAAAAGVWWPELHGYTHLPERAWLTALRRSLADARRGFEQQVFVCEAVEASGEFDRAEPAALRARKLERALAAFARHFGRPASSFCAPDYRWDDAFEAEAEARGVTLWQGRSERDAVRGGPLGRWLARRAWRPLAGARFTMPPRIAFEPRGMGTHLAAPADPRVGAVAAHAHARAAWAAGRPAVVSTHRVSYAHLDPDWSEASVAALRDLLARLAGDGAVFLTDAETRQIHERGWSTRPVGAHGTLLRYYHEPGLPIRFPAPADATGVRLREGQGHEGAELGFEGGSLEARVQPGAYLIEWRAA